MNIFLINKYTEMRVCEDMNKIISHFNLIILLTCSILLTACGGNEQTAEELIRYHNEEWIPLTEKRNKALKGHGWP